MFERFKTIHFVGIGGIGMSGIAEVLLNLGYEVSGSDIKDSDNTQRLRRLGAKIYIGHREGNVDSAHVVVVSSAISSENLEIKEAKRRLIPVIPRAEMLAELGRLKYSILVAGAHGKTTTTSFVSTLLASSGLDPTVIIGGKLKAIGTNARLGRGDFLVAEADESDGSFLKLNPTIGVVTNIDREHMEFFKTIDALKEAFLAFINKVPFYGASILCIDNEHIRKLLPNVHRKVITYGLTEGATLSAYDIKKDGLSMSFKATFMGRSLGRFKIPMPGIHNVLNSLAAIAVALELRIDTKRIKTALSGFEGIQRRLEYKGSFGGIRVFDDYGHHPSEIRATLSALKDSLNGKRLSVIFQPHRFSRTRDLFNDFIGAFSDADSLYLMDIYSAGESPIKGITSKALYEEMRKTHKDVIYMSDRERLAGLISERLMPGETLLSLGAGDVWKMADEVLKRLSERFSDGKHNA